MPEIAFCSGVVARSRNTDTHTHIKVYSVQTLKILKYIVIFRDATPHSTPNPTPTQGTPVHAASAHNSADNSERVIPVEVAKSETIFSGEDFYQVLNQIRSYPT